MRQRLRNALASFWKGEGAIQESDRVRSVYIERVAVAKFVLKGTDQIPPCKFAWCWGGSGVQLKESVWPMASASSGFWPDGASVNHPLDRGPMSILSKILQHRVEEV